MTEQRTVPPLTKDLQLPRLPLAVFLLLVVAISLSGYWFYQNQKAKLFKSQTDDLSAIADLKAEELSRWLDEKESDAHMISQNPLLSSGLAAYLADPAPGARKDAIQHWIRAMQDNYHYANVLLIDRAGKVAIAGGPIHAAIASEVRLLLETARQSRDVAISQLHIIPHTSDILLDLAAPVVAGNEIRGFILLRIDPAQYLFPLIQKWPTPSPSAETLLVRRDGDEVLFLNELRHRKNTALKMRLPVNSRELPAAMAILGKTGAFSGRDYRGMAVWSVVRPVPGSPWFIVAKIDRDEIERPIRQNALGIFLITLTLIMAASAVILFLWQRQKNRFRLRQLEAENQRQALVQHFDYLSRYANDIILLADEKGNILEANERAEFAYGYDRQSLLGMNLYDLRAPEEKEKLTEHMRQIEAKTGSIFETEHQKKNGLLFPVEVSARVIAVDDKKYFQSIIRDISERRKAETAIRENESLLRTIAANFPNSFLSIIEKDLTIGFTSGREFSRLNLDPKQFVGLTLEQVFADQAAVVREHYLQAFAGKAQSFELFINGQNQLYNVVPLPALDGTIPRILAVVENISERKKAEEELVRSESKFRSTFDQSPVGAAMVALDKHFIRCNKAFCDFIGFSEQELIGKTIAEITLPEDVEIGMAELKRIVGGELDSSMVQKRYLRKDGKTVWGEVTISLVRDANGNPLFFLPIIQDINQRKQAETALRESEDKFKYVFDNSMIAKSITLPNGEINVNKAFCTMLGYSPEELKARKWQELTHREDIQLTQQALDDILSGRKVSIRFEKRYLRKNGSVVFADVSTTLRRNAAGQPVYFMTSILDISERKKAEEEIKASRAFLEMVIEMSPFSMWISDREGTVTKVNHSLCQTIHLAADQIVGKYNVFMDKNLTDQGVMPRVKAVFEKHEPARFPILWQAASAGSDDFKDARDMHMDVSMFPILDARGELTNVVCQWIDVTDWKRAENEIRSLSARYQTLLEAVPDIIMEVDTNRVYTWANRAGIEFFGDDVIGREASEYFLGEQKVYQTVKPLFNGYEDTIYLESWQRRRDGEKRLLAWWCRVLKNETGEVTGALSSARDITEIKLAENEIRRLNEELEHRVLERTAQLQASNRELEAFSYSVSHDLRAPLRAIEGFSRIVLEEYAAKLDNEARRLFEVITGNTRKMSHLIDDLLAFSRLNRQRMIVNPVDLAAMARTIFKELAGMETGRKIEFKIGDLPVASGDRSMLQQVLQNLLANAIKFTRPRAKPRIEMLGWEGSGENIYQVKDNGVGFDMDYADKLFGVFQRLHGSEEFEGTGVGLAIVQRIILRHGGRVWAESGKKNGATFYFALPLETIAEAEDEERENVKA